MEGRELNGIISVPERKGAEWSNFCSCEVDLNCDSPYLLIFRVLWVMACSVTSVLGLRF